MSIPHSGGVFKQRSHKCLVGCCLDAWAVYLHIPPQKGQSVVRFHGDVLECVRVACSHALWGLFCVLWWGLGIFPGETPCAISAPIFQSYWDLLVVLLRLPEMLLPDIQWCHQQIIWQMSSYFQLYRWCKTGTSLAPVPILGAHQTSRWPRRTSLHRLRLLAFCLPGSLWSMHWFCLGCRCRRRPNSGYWTRRIPADRNHRRQYTSHLLWQLLGVVDNVLTDHSSQTPQ